MSIHVFDLDDTLIFHDDMRLNHELVALLHELCNRRDSKKNVSAIFLLTNNGDLNFITMIVDILDDEIYGSNSKKHIFDYILWRHHSARNGPSDNPTKSLNDVYYMLNQSKIPFTPSTPIFFYDDLKHHVLQSEIPESNFIHVKPSNTDLTPVTSFLTNSYQKHLKGGKRNKSSKYFRLKKKKNKSRKS
jgi:hypothetical protein